MTQLEPKSMQEWIDGIAASLTVACSFITDPQGRVLVVNPTYRDEWQFVGGLVDKGEGPHEGCAREVAEEIGMDLPVGDLLVLDWVQSVSEFGGASLTVYMFDGGVIADPDRIRLQEDELEDFKFLPPEKAAGLMADFNSVRIGLALEAKRTGRTAFQPTLRTR